MESYVKCQVDECQQPTLKSSTYSRSVIVFGWTESVPEDLAEKYCGSHAQQEMVNARSLHNQDSQASSTNPED